MKNWLSKPGDVAPWHHEPLTRIGAGVELREWPALFCGRWLLAREPPANDGQRPATSFEMATNDGE